MAPNSFTQTIRSLFRSKSSSDSKGHPCEERGKAEHSAHAQRQTKRSLSKQEKATSGRVNDEASGSRSSRMKVGNGSAEEAALAHQRTPEAPAMENKQSDVAAAKKAPQPAEEKRDSKPASPEVVEIIRSFFQSAEHSESNRYTIKEIIGKGSYGVVASAVDNFTGEQVAIKRVSNIFECVADAVRILREIKLLRLLKHPDIVDIKHIMLPPDSSHYKDIYIVFELMESDLHNVIKMNQGGMTNEHFQFFLYQMIRGLMYIHSARVFHRDLKPRNILANANCKLKICDLGLARPEFLDSQTSMVMWTDYVATRWYRAPELCGTFCSKYTTSVDMWSMGCIFAEIMLGRPLFPGKNVAHQMELITDIVGTPTPMTLGKIRNERTRRYLHSMGYKPKTSFRRLFPRADQQALDLLEKMLHFDPDLRPSAEEALEDPYFDNLRDPSNEPLAEPVSKLDFEFENRNLSAQDARDLIYEEILEYHPRVKEDHLKNRKSSFANPSAIDSFKRQFLHLEQNGPGGVEGVGRVGITGSLQKRGLQNWSSLPRNASTMISGLSNSNTTSDRGGGGGGAACSGAKEVKKSASVYVEGAAVEMGLSGPAADAYEKSSALDGRSSWSPGLDTKYPPSLGQSRQPSGTDASAQEADVIQGMSPLHPNLFGQSMFGLSPEWQPISSVSGPSLSSTVAQRFSSPGLIDLPPLPQPLELWGSAAAAVLTEGGGDGGGGSSEDAARMKKNAALSASHDVFLIPMSSSDYSSPYPKPRVKSASGAGSLSSSLMMRKVSSRRSVGGAKLKSISRLHAEIPLGEMSDSKAKMEHGHGGEVLTVTDAVARGVE